MPLDSRQCAALETPSGEGSGAQHVTWCDRFLKHHLTGREWYKVRCRTLHQAVGTFAPNESRFETISWVDPDSGPEFRHGYVAGNNLTLNVAELCDEMLRGLEQWAEAISSQPAVLANVERNRTKVVRLQTKIATYEHGGVFRIVIDRTMSST